MIIGMDFGTTNTGAAAFDGVSIQAIPLDPFSNTPSVCRSAIYITRGRDYHQGAINKDKTLALMRVVSSNYALYMFELVERAKRQLSVQAEAAFSFKARDFMLEEKIPRSRFEEAIRRDYEAIIKELGDTLARSGLKPGDIDRVIRTGGSSQIPMFVQLLEAMFGAEKVMAIDIFSSVTSGLAIRGHEIASGQSAFAEYTLQSVKRTEELTSGNSRDQVIQQIDLDSVLQRIVITEEYQDSQKKLPESVALVLDGDCLTVFPIARISDTPSRLNSDQPFLPPLVELSESSKVLIARIEEVALLATNQFNLISTPVQALFVAQQVNDEGIRETLRLEKDEVVTAMVTWGSASPATRYLSLVTKYGQARSFEARLLVEQLAKRPQFALERRYTGFPIWMAPANEDEMIVIGTNLGRLGRAMARDASVIVNDILRVRKDEEVTAAAICAASEGLLAISDHGYLVPVQTDTLPMNAPPASRGQTLRRNFRIIGFIPVTQALETGVFALSTHGRLLYHLLHASPDKASSIHRAFRLNSDEKVFCLITKT